MASISGATSSNTISSLYNSSNVISGLASGLDTEGMIENLVKSYQTKINSLNQQATKTEWKQEAYRSIISKLVGFTQKYTSYNSPATNLLSPSFFNNAVKVTTQGLYKDKVTASGKTSSDIALNAVHQLATAAQYRVGDGLLKTGDGTSIQASDGLDLSGKTTLGALNGSMTVIYGSQKLNINFNEVTDKEAIQEIQDKLGSKASQADVLAGLINQKLEGQKITFSNGQSENAQDRVQAVAEGNSIVFKDLKDTAGNALYISSASGNVAKTLGLDLDKADENKDIKSFSLDGLKVDGKVKLTREEDTADYLSGKTMNLTLDGTTKQIKLPTIKDGKLVDADGNPLKITGADGKEKDISELNGDNYAEAVNDALNKVFKGKVTASNALSGAEGKNAGKLQLRLEVQKGSDLLVNTDVGEALGIGQSASTYLNTSKTLEDLLGKDMGGLTPTKDKDGKDVYAFKINDVTIGKYTKDTKLSTILNDINSNKDAGVKVSYSQTTKEFLFSAKETGADSEIVMGGGLAQVMFGDSQNTVETSSTMGDILGKDYNFEDVYSFKLNIGGKTHEIGLPFEKENMKDVTLDEMVTYINGSLSGTGMKATLDVKGSTISVTDKDGNKVDVSGGDSLTEKLLNTVADKSIASYSKGQDAKFTATINGKQMEMTRSSNSVSIDGLTINMKETFDSSVKKDKDGNPMLDDAGNAIKNLDKNGNPVYSADDSVTFKSTTDSDKIVDVVKTMIEDYNAMLSEIRGAYSTLPAQKTDGSSYEPLTSDQASNYSESEQQKYEEKAKQGLLFADRDLSSLYDKLRNVFSPAGQDGSILRGMGISTSYDVGTGALTITLDEDKFRSMLDSDPDMVADAFTKTSGIGGVMQNLKTTLDTYAKTSGEPKGILIQKAGSPLSPLSLMSNTWQKQIDNYNKQIEKWQDKLSNQVDRYTQQFSRLEQLIAQMNSQSSSLASLMGG